VRAGASQSGISDFVSFLERTSAYRQDLRRAEYGDERDPQMRAYLQRISPLPRAGLIRDPIFISAGANDPRVPLAEAEQIVAAVRARGGIAWSLIAADEGHGFARKANRDYHFRASVLFWKKTLLDQPTSTP
jgi:dipeptidyl aminopeptidase/acylaminoacyl peptidase